MQIALTPAFHEAYPDGIFGALIASGCPNRPRASTIDPDQRAVEARLRERFPNETIYEDPVALAYAKYFRRYGSRYPVVHQARTILSGKPIEGPSALVEIMFTAEIDSLVLTSGHDLRALCSPLLVDAAQAGEVYTRLSGQAQTLKAADMVVRDAEGIIASVLYGPDARTRLRAASDAVLYGVWCPIGIPLAVIHRHLQALTQLVRREWPEATIAASRIVGAPVGEN
jgi:DNA/RNA-binding domain of Phe-tRNA-synthetase-like protein